MVNDDMVITLEDDVYPPLDGLDKLIEAYPAYSNVAGIGGVYDSRNGGIVGSTGIDFWEGRLFRKDCTPNKIMTVGCIAAGFTVWNNAYLRNCLPFVFNYYNGIPSGWDGNASRNIKAQGGLLQLHCGVDCFHAYDVPCGCQSDIKKEIEHGL
jgi:hypothetical protein